MHVVLIIALEDKHFAEAQQRYLDAGGKAQVIHVRGVRTDASLRKESCTFFARMFCTDAMIGIGVAHRRAWQMAAQFDHAIIFEEDVQFDKNFDEQRALSLLRTNDFVALGNILTSKTSHNVCDHIKHVLATTELVPRASEGVYRVRWLWGAHAYAATRRTFIEFLRMLPRVHWHVDAELTKARNKFRMVGFRPSMCFQDMSRTSQAATNANGKRDEVSLKYALTFRVYRVFKQDVCLFEVLMCALVVFVLVVMLLVATFCKT